MKNNHGVTENTEEILAQPQTQPKNPLAKTRKKRKNSRCYFFFAPLWEICFENRCQKQACTGRHTKGTKLEKREMLQTTA